MVRGELSERDLIWGPIDGETFRQANLAKPSCNSRYVMHYCFRAVKRASGQDFGRILIGSASESALRPAGEPILRLSRLESGRNPAHTDLHGLWPAKAPREALWPTYHYEGAVVTAEAS